MLTRIVALVSGLVGAVVSAGCASSTAPPANDPPVALEALEVRTKAVATLLDDWHAAAARADEAAYFGAFAREAVFLGTDATERWDVAAFRAYAHPRFAVGKSWKFTSTARRIQFSQDASVAWFDEDLQTPNLGPARGSGVIVREAGAYKIAQYNLSVPIPNERFEAVRHIIAGTP